VTPDRLRDFGIIALKDFGSILSMAKTTCSPRLGLRRAPGQKFGAFEQVFGANQQVPHAGGCEDSSSCAAETIRE
jgi:hypothetical protein